MSKSETYDQLQAALKMKLCEYGSTEKKELSEDDLRIIEQIRVETGRRNRNNITRTEAYLDFYLKHPEIHWAHLAHLVSRNGGWTMTDLKGEFLPKLLTEKERENFFLFLERGNGLIFRDAFPQLLLYAESISRNWPLFHLLPYFQVSSFMEVVWQQYWRTKDRYMLAVAMVINEQSFLEQQVLQNKFYIKSIFESIAFNVQESFRLNQILFPVGSMDGKPELIGQNVYQFASCEERILLGKRLYTLLLEDMEKQNRILQWAKAHPHTGSRKDYWPHLFNDVKETVPGRLYNPQLKNCSLKPGATRLFSPHLQYAWKDVKQPEPMSKDWFNDLDVMDLLKERTKNVDGAIEHAYCKTLEALAFTVFTKKAMFLRR